MLAKHFGYLACGLLMGGLSLGCDASGPDRGATPAPTAPQERGVGVDVDTRKGPGVDVDVGKGPGVDVDIGKGRGVDVDVGNGRGVDVDVRAKKD